MALHASASWVGDHDVLATLVDVAAMQCDEAAIRRYAPQAEELALTHGHTLYEAITHRAWGVAHRLAGEHVAARTRLQKALEIFRRLGAHWQIGRTLFALGELAVEQSDATAARALYSEALAAFETMKAMPDASLTRAALASLQSS